VEERLRRLEDLEAIRALDARYTRVLDANDRDGLMDRFTPDGEFHGLDHTKGHDELRPFFAGLVAGGLTQFWHHVSNLEIDLDGETARLSSLLWQPCVQGRRAVRRAGRYTDVVVRTASGGATAPARSTSRTSSRSPGAGRQARRPVRRHLSLEMLVRRR
jgi:ketosteroid isomerase-like protein